MDLTGLSDADLNAVQERLIDVLLAIGQEKVLRMGGDRDDDATGHLHGGPLDRRNLSYV